MSDREQPPSAVHVPVLLREVLEQLDLQPGLTVVDGTVGAGGHSRKILQQLGPDGRLIGIDRDPMMLALAGSVLDDSRCTLRQGSYAELDPILDELQIARVDRLLVDLGLSSDQLADRRRGFGFDAGGPLDLRFDTTAGESAAEWLARASEAEIARVLADYGEEPYAPRMARAIVEHRRGASITTARDLVDVVARAVHGGSRGAKHPATRVFQALRIFVNAELEQLETLLNDVLPRRLSPGGRALIITFHSLEDRLVKEAFRETAVWESLTRKPIVATPAEVRRNPRSRSAKLRVALRRPLAPTG